MVIYLYGIDSYLREKKVRGLVAEYRSRHKDADFFYADLADGLPVMENALAFLEQPSLFVPSKLIVARGGGRLAEGGEYSAQDVKEWAAALKRILSGKDVFAVVVDEDRPLAAFKFLLKEPVKAQEFPALLGDRLDAFIVAEARELDVKLDAEARRCLVRHAEQTGEDGRGWVVRRALEKFALADAARIQNNLDVFRELIGWRDKEEGYPLALNFLGSRNQFERLKLLERLRARGDDARYTMNLLCSLARRPEDVFALARSDVLVKSGALDDETALTGLALDIVSES